MRQGEALGLRWEYLVGYCLECERTATAADSWSRRKTPQCPACGGDCVIEARVWHQLQRLTWRHGCTDITACTEAKHKRPCPPDCPKAARTSGRRHTCIKPGDGGVCPPGCARHASTCPKRISGGLVLREIKERRRKTIPLAPELAGLLRSHWMAQRAERLAAADLWEDHDLMFCQPDGRPISPRDDWQEWADILQAAGIPHHGVHAARHSAATIAIDEGVALTIVQEMLGHSDIRVTRGYVHTASPLARDAAARMGRALFGKGGETADAAKIAPKRRAPRA